MEMLPRHRLELHRLSSVCHDLEVSCPRKEVKFDWVENGEDMGSLQM